jgi:hypothetical protein
MSGRYDVTFHQPWIRSQLASLETAKYPAVNLGTVIQNIRYGTGTPPPYLSPGTDTVPFVRATDIKDGEINTNTLFYVALEQPKHMEKCLLDGGELIIVRSGVNTGDCAVVPTSLAGAYAAYDLILTFKDAVSAEFVSAFLDTELGRLQLNLVSGRAAQPHVNAEEVAALILPLPPLNKQRELVAAMDIARSARRAKLAEADALLAGLDGFLLNALGLVAPEKAKRTVFAIRNHDLQKRFDPKTYLYSRHSQSTPYPNVTFGSLTIQEPDYGSGSRAIPRVSEDEPKYIRITDFQDDGIPLGHEFMTAEVIEPECKLFNEDMLFARSGATAGKTFLYTDNLGPAIFAGYCIRFRFNRSHVLPRFVHYF